MINVSYLVAKTQKQPSDISAFSSYTNKSKYNSEIPGSKRKKINKVSRSKRLFKLLVWTFNAFLIWVRYLKDCLSVIGPLFHKRRWNRGILGKIVLFLLQTIFPRGALFSVWVNSFRFFKKIKIKTTCIKKGPKRSQLLLLELSFISESTRNNVLCYIMISGTF